jgi:hypothetical protein
LLGKFALLALARFFTLHRALGSSGGDGLALLSFLDGGRPFDERRFEFCRHQLLESLHQSRRPCIAQYLALRRPLRRRVLARSNSIKYLEHYCAPLPVSFVQGGEQSSHHIRPNCL